MVELGGLELSPELGGNRRQCRLVGFGEPTVGHDRVRKRRAGLALDLLAEPEDVVEEPASLVLLDVEAGQ